MTRGRERLLRAVAVFAAMLAALAFGMEGETVRAAADPAPTHVTNSLTTQFPLGRQKLCCTSKPHRRAATPARPAPTVSRTTSVTSSASSATTARASSSRTTSQPPLLGQRGDGSAAPFIVVGAVILACLVAAEIGRLSVRRRRRARRRARAAAATARAAAAAVAQPAARSSEVAPSHPAVPQPAPSRPAPFQRSDAPARAAPDANAPSPAAPDPGADVPAPVAPDPDPPVSPALPGSSGADVADEELIANPPAADEELIADPLAQLEREIFERRAAARAAAASRGRQPGDGTYRLGEVLYERGRLEEAAAAWRLAASKQHAGAAARLAELRKETGDTDTHS